MIEAESVWKGSTETNTAVSWLDAHKPAARRWPPYRGACIRSCCAATQERSDGGGGSPARTAWRVAQGPRVSRLAVPRVIGSRSSRKFICIALANDHGTGVLKTSYNL